MNINATIKKLQTAILQTGLAVSISRTQFYSAEQQRFIPIITLSTKVLAQNKKGEWKERDYTILRTSSQTEILLCMVEIYKVVSR